MSEELIVKHCSPTLAGIKTGNIFSCAFQDKFLFERQVLRLKKLLAERHLKMRILKIVTGRALVYVYSPDRLARDMTSQEVTDFMRNLGYTLDNVEGCIDQLGRRIIQQNSFPHEIGLFLSYPFHDVQAFIQNKGKNYKLSGFWKVYYNESAAAETFERYRKCTVFYLEMMKQGCLRL